MPVRKIKISASVAMASLPSSMLEAMRVRTAARRPPAARARRAPASGPRRRAAPAHVEADGGAATEVYVLELEGGRVYVGKSSCVAKRVRQHVGGAGADFTKAWKPTGRLLPRLGNLQGSGDGPERDETLRQMHAKGVDRVRGWRYCARTLSARDKKEIELEIRELYDLCRICGKGKHFARQCKARPPGKR